MDKLELSRFAQYLKPRPLDCNKGDFGKVLIIGGDLGFSGAALLAGEAALRVGAGSVHIATRPEHAQTLNVSRPELMCHGVTKPSEIEDIFSSSTVVVIGPGLGKQPWGRELLHFTLQSNKPLLLDADALNILAETPSIKPRENWILTPHPGEAARLLKESVADIQKHRLASLKKLHDKFGGTIVLKGAGTLTISKDKNPTICPMGNPGMATAGMGDVLSGTIAGLIAQKIPLAEATNLGVLVHAMAGDQAAQQGQRGLIATDVIMSLRNIVNSNLASIF